MSLTRQERPAGFAPDSPYARLNTIERTTLEAAECEHNMRAAAVAILAGQTRGGTVRRMSDRMLTILHRRASHKIESALKEGDARRARLLRARQRDLACEMAMRHALAEAWLAVEDGTCSYVAFQARGGLAAVAEHGATPPSYQLAILLDFEAHRRGLSCTLAWGDAERSLS